MAETYTHDAHRFQAEKLYAALRSSQEEMRRATRISFALAVACGLLAFLGNTGDRVPIPFVAVSVPWCHAVEVLAIMVGLSEVRIGVARAWAVSLEAELVNVPASPFPNGLRMIYHVPAVTTYVHALLSSTTSVSDSFVGRVFKEVIDSAAFVGASIAILYVVAVEENRLSSVVAVILMALAIMLAKSSWVMPYQVLQDVGHTGLAKRGNPNVR